MLIVQVREKPLRICIRQDRGDLAWLPALFNALPEVWKRLVVGSDREGVSGPALPANVAYHVSCLIKAEMTER